MGDYIGISYTTDDSYLNRGSPLYTLRQGWWTEIFNLGMRSSPAGGLMLQLEALEELTMALGKLLHQLAFCSRVYNFEFKNAGARMTVVTLAYDLISLYSGPTAAVAFTVPARAVAINCLTGISALLDVIRCYFTEQPAFLRTQANLYGAGAEARAAASPFWALYQQYEREAFEWLGLNDRFKNISFNVLGRRSGERIRT